MLIKILSCVLISGAFLTNVYAVDTQPIIHERHFHEAYMAVEAQMSLLTAVATQPPSLLREKPPVQIDTQTIWVPGYWEWSLEKNDFVWCCGLWRRPPPNHVWVEGYWKQTAQGWVRIKGFWSTKSATQLSYIPKPPPDSLNENPSGKPGADYFWMAGYWHYDQRTNNYIWYSGKWEKLDPAWIYVPASYYWRPEGYVFEPAHWDWPLESRGFAYACVYIPENQRQQEFTPTFILEPRDVITGCFFYYPDYYYFFCHHYYFHMQWWWDFAWCPPWWAWDWWWFPWEDHWALWWWWSHPGFPAPGWLPPEVIVIIFGPPQDLIIAMQKIHGPIIITPEGVVTPDGLLDTLGQNQPPIFPQDPSQQQQQAADMLLPSDTRRPSGPHTSLEDLHNNPQPLPQTTPKPTQPLRPGQQPPLPSIPPTVITPPKPSMPPAQQYPTPPTQTIPPRQPQPPLPPSQTVPPRQPRPPTPAWPSQPPGQTRPPTRPPVTPPSTPSWPSQPPSQTRPPTTPSWPSQPPGQTRPPTAPSWPSKPPSQTQPPSRTPSTPSWPSQPNLQRPSYTPSVPQYQPRNPTYPLSKPQ